MQMKTLAGQSPTLASMFRKSDIVISRSQEVASSDEMSELMAMFGDASLTGWAPATPRYKSVSPIRTPVEATASLVRRTPSCSTGLNTSQSAPSGLLAAAPRPCRKSRDTRKISSSDADKLLSGEIDVQAPAANSRLAMMRGDGVFSVSCPTLPVSEEQGADAGPLASPKRRRFSPTRGSSDFDLPSLCAQSHPETTSRGNRPESVM
jgi:hypothetical protein